MSEKAITHELKTDPAPFEESWRGRKPWEIRYNDRNFQAGDRVRLRETRFTGEQMREHPHCCLEYTGRELIGRIRYVMGGAEGSPFYGLREGWVVFTVDLEASRIVEDGKIVDHTDLKLAAPEPHPTRRVGQGLLQALHATLLATYRVGSENRLSGHPGIATLSSSELDGMAALLRVMDLGGLGQLAEHLSVSIEQTPDAKAFLDGEASHG